MLGLNRRMGGGLFFCLVFLLALPSCGLFTAPFKPTLLKTKEAAFYLDRRFNTGLALPLDICFIPLKGSAAAVTSIKAEDWFGKHKREKYAFKQALSFRPGRRSPVIVKLQVPADTQSLVIKADYINLTGSRGQQLVLPAPGKPREVVFVTDKGIYR